MHSLCAAEKWQAWQQQLLYMPVYCQVPKDDSFQAEMSRKVPGTET